MTTLCVELLSKAHDKQEFDCGVDELNTYLARYSFQNQKSNIVRTFVAVDPNCKTDDKKEILGYYTLSTGQIGVETLPSQHNHPRYPVSIVRIARLAISNQHQGKGLGGALLYDALNKIVNISQMVGIYAVVVDAKDQSAKSFYEHYGFESIVGYEMTLILPMKTIAKLF